jgi:hypothetical protein
MSLIIVKEIYKSDKFFFKLTLIKRDRESKKKKWSKKFWKVPEKDRAPNKKSVHDSHSKLLEVSDHTTV